MDLAIAATAAHHGLAVLGTSERSAVDEHQAEGAALWALPPRGDAVVCSSAS
ncbi:hypothetical protein ACFZCU_46740 [Streptomyces canus]|uniref:hypothetical protein n=1 Tax=Streptomyces canus TaxID=58343 RepID=UPI0036EACDE7